jgi:RNA polymerase subunit RPABC4/transcription elongation factor Spt4
MAIICKSCKRALTPQQVGEPCPYCGSRDRNLSIQDLAVLKGKAAAAKELAKRHYEIEPGLTRVIRCSGSAEVELNRAEPINSTAQVF